MRRLITMAVRRRVTVIMVSIAIVVFGFVGYQRLSLELFPRIDYPSLTIQTAFPDTAPQEIESLITRPVEEAVGVLRGLQSITSVSRSGVSEVTLEFDWDTDMDLLSMEVREKLDRLVLTEGSEAPIVLRYDPSLDPIIRLALSGPGPLIHVRRLADKRLKQDFESIKGVAATIIRGGHEDEVQIQVDQERLATLGISFDRVRQVVGVSNVNLPGGLLRGESSQYLIRTMNEFDTVEEIGELIIDNLDDRIVRLKDVATVVMGVKERDYISRVNGEECVELAIYREGEANTVNVARLVHERIERWRETVPAGYQLTVLFDQSQFISQSLRDVRHAALFGGILAILVIFLFLRDVRSTIIIATSIPLSVIATFVFMYRMDISLNIMSLGGLTLGIGMLVDNSIVVLESIARRRERGHALVRAAISGTSEVGPAVVASTLTTVAVFLPIVFVEGIAGQLFRDQALTVTISLLVSLLVALTVIPMFSAIRADIGYQGSALEDRKRTRTTRTEDQTDTIMMRDQASFGSISRWYDQLVRRAISYRWLTVGLAVGLFLVSVLLLGLLGTELIPALSEGEFSFEVIMPEGTSLLATDQVVRQMENIAAGQPTLAYTYSTVGSSVKAGGLSLNTRGEHLGQIHMLMKDRSDDRGEARTIEVLRRHFREIPDLTLTFGRPSYFSLKMPVEVVIYGHDLELLREYSLQLADRIAVVEGLVDVRSSLEAGNPELQVIFDRVKLASLGLDLGTLSQTLRNRVQGVVPTRFKEEDRLIDIRIRNTEQDRRTFNDIRNLIIPGPDGKPIRLMHVAEVHRSRGPAEIHRLQQQRAAVISASLSDRSLSEAVSEIERIITSMPPPEGAVVELGGQNREMEVSFASLRFAIVLAIFLVYLVMASTFESFIHPFLVLFTIPLALIGVVAGLFLTGTTISVIVFLGTIMLVGIVVNNAIVLIDAINRLRRQGIEKVEAVIMAGHLRLRPILMTTLSTVLALLPMAISWGEGAELRAPLAITVVSGLLLSTLLTLVVIPAVYVIVPSRTSGLEELIGSDDQPDTDTPS